MVRPKEVLLLARLNNPVAENEKKATFIAAFVAFAAYLAIAYNWYCSSFVGGAGYVFTSASLNGLTQIAWFLLPVVWLGTFFKFGKLWLKIIAGFGLLFVGISTTAATIWLSQSIVTNTDKYRTTIDISSIDENSNDCSYRVEPLFPYGTGRIGCIEEKILPGIIYVRIRERASLDDRWQPLIQIGTHK